MGRIENTVTVEATTPQISTEDSSVGTVVDNTYVSRFPLFLRSWDDLLGLVAGVQGNRYTEQSGATSARRTGGFNVHGVRSLQNNFLLDGVDNNSISENVQELTTQVVRPSVDTIQEFKIITNPLPLPPRCSCSATDSRRISSIPRNSTCGVCGSGPSIPSRPIPPCSSGVFGLQRKLPVNLFVQAGYVGAKTTHLTGLLDYNQPINGVLPYPNFGYIEYRSPTGNGIYHGLDLTLTSNSGNAQDGRNYRA